MFFFALLFILLFSSCLFYLINKLRLLSSSTPAHFLLLLSYSLLLSAINLLKEREPGAFIIRDSHSFRGAYGLAMKVACPPPTVQQNKKGDKNKVSWWNRFLSSLITYLCNRSTTECLCLIYVNIFPVGDMTNELVRHFLIETSPKGVRLKGCPNEPYFGEFTTLLLSLVTSVV